MVAALRILLKRSTLALLLIALAAYGSVLARMYWYQESYLFLPTPLPKDFRFSLPDVHELSVGVNGARLSALHMRLPNSKGLVFYLHGNAGNLDSWFVNSDFYRKANYDLFMIDYRGFGKSSGSITSEAQLKADARQAWDSIAPLYAGKRKVIIGRSLGTDLAASLAADVQPDLTVLISPYFSMATLARQYYPLVPGFVLRYPLATWQDVARIRTPLLLVHGDQDALIPFENSERLLRFAARGKLLRIPGADHDNVQDFPVYSDTLAAYLQSLP